MKRLEAPPNIVDAIREKERREKRLKWRSPVRLLSFVLAIGTVAVAGTAFWLQARTPESAFRTFRLEELTVSQVNSLFQADPSPILIVGASGQTDTIRREQEFRLLLAAMADHPISGSREEAVSVNPTTLPVSQEDLSEEEELPTLVTNPLNEADVMPAFPGGEAALYRFLSNHLRYPADALRNKVEGKVFLRFVIDTQGAVSDVRVVRSLGHGCDEEALRVVRMMPNWIPGELAGQKVPVYSSLAVNFKFL